ncbi:organomercurial lyase [Halovenus sp. HT40]|uniref:organomercurial lyase n=1 Tax=Halovenus sp. HT40 TaxID=3126691 RepID=UPI00300F1674
MTEHCSCCGTVTESQTESAGRNLTAENPLQAELPAEMSATLGQFLGRESVTTFDEWAAEIRQTVGGSIAVEDLCSTEERTAHWAVRDGERQYFLCFYDAVILAALSEQSVEIHTKSPGGTVIEARAVGTDTLEVTPKEAVFSLGVEENAANLVDGNPTLEDAYGAVCPYVKAFPNADSYREWAEAVPAATIGLELDGATEFAAALLEDVQ